MYSVGQSQYINKTSHTQDAKTADIRRILPVPAGLLLAVLAGILSYLGASNRPFLVSNPFMASAVVGVCFFFLLFPFTRIDRTLFGVLSPEAMGGIGYLIFIGVAGVMNYISPGLAVNPSLFDSLPLAIIAQTIAALLFFAGARVAKDWGMHSRRRETHMGRLIIVLLIYAAFTLYLSIFSPRVDATELALRLRSGASVPWLISVGTYIIFQSLPMLVVAFIYLRDVQYWLVRVIIIVIFGFSAVLFIVSGSRSYSVQLILLIFIATIIAQKTVSKKMIGIVFGLAVAVFAMNTILRLVAPGFGGINQATFTPRDVNERLGLITTNRTVGFADVLRNLHENLVYHLSDNQTMAMLIRNQDSGPLMGRASFASILSALPSTFRPSGHISGTNEILLHYRFYKERATDANYLPDWQITLGAFGFADFWLVGLALFPFMAGLVFRWVYNRTVLTDGLGQVGWLVYVPLLFYLWNPFLLGPDSTQTLRLLIPMAFLLFWTTKRRDRFFNSPVLNSPAANR